MSIITDHLKEVKERINQAAQKAERDPSGILLLAVSNTAC